MRALTDVPAGTIGFEAIGGVERDAMKADAGFRARHASSFDRVAVVSDKDRMRPARGALSFLMPRKAKGFLLAELDDTNAWLAAE